MRTAMVRGAILGALMLAACSAHTKHEWLSFFFDGVPPEKTEVSPGDVQRPLVLERQTGTPAALSPAAKAPARIVHRPYGERRCDACHESKFSQKMRGETGEICLLCHKNLFTDAKFRHAPAAAGYCLGCHDPHESSEKFLLVNKGQRLCRDCHDEQDVAGTTSHTGIGETACQSCHFPHGGENRLFLRPDAKRPPTGPSGPAAS